MNRIIHNLKNLINRFKVYLTNSGWVLLGYAIRLLIVIFIFSKIADLVGKEDFGWYNLGISCFTILFALSTLGFDSSYVVKKLVQEKQSEQKQLIGTFFFGRMLFSLLLLSGLTVYVLFFAKDQRSWVLVIASLSAIFQAYEIFYFYFQWKFKANIYVTAEIISMVFSSLGFLFGLWQQYDIFYFISIYSLERFIFLLALVFYFHKNVFPFHSLSINFKELKKHLLLAWPIMTGDLLTALYARFDQFLIAPLLSMEDLGIYNPSVILTQIWLVVPSLIVPIIYPKIATLKQEKNAIRYKEILFTAYGVLNYLAIGVVVFMLLFGKFIIVNLYGDQYLESIPLLYIMVFIILILFQSHLTSYVLILEGEEKYVFILKLVGVVLNVVLNLLFLKNYGVAFAPWSLVISAIVSWILMGAFNKKMRRLIILNLQSFLLIFHLKKVLR